MVLGNQISPHLSSASGRANARADAANTLRQAGLLTATLKDQAARHGFSAIGIAASSACPEAGERLRAYLAKGHHGDMIWMEETADRRSSPQALWADVKSVIMLGVNYAPAHNPLEHASHQERGVISVYAQGADYHDIIKKRLKALARWFVENCGAEVKVFVDTAPVMEKPLAAAAGVGWQGKHTNLVSRRYGSWLFLGAIYTTAELEPDPSHPELCGSCTACQTACPTAAFPAPYQLDARRCISYLTIEHKGPIPKEFRPAIGNRIYGCDDCLAVCPWNKFAQAAHEIAFMPRIELMAPHLKDLLQLDEQAFRAVFAGSPLKRVGRDRFIRNVLIAAGNSAERSLLATVSHLLQDDNPLVRGAAIWACKQLATEAELGELRKTFEAGETDDTVLQEWRDEHFISGQGRVVAHQYTVLHRLPDHQ